MDPIEKTKIYMKELFQKHPHHSFNDWRIMYDHSVFVYGFAMKIAESLEDCDNIVVSVGALLHDIGKTYLADEETLHQIHDKLGFIVSEDFLKTLGLSNKQFEKLRCILANEGTCVEKEIINDADIISYFADSQLQRAFEKWVLGRNQPEKILKKKNNFKKLKFDKSKELVKQFLD